MINFIAEHIDTLIASLVAGLGSWFFTRKQQEADVKVTEGNALEGMQRAYDKLVEDMNQKFAELKLENAELKSEIQLLHKENIELKKMLRNL